DAGRDRVAPVADDRADIASVDEAVAGGVALLPGVAADGIAIEIPKQNHADVVGVDRSVEVRIAGEPAEDRVAAVEIEKGGIGVGEAEVIRPIRLDIVSAGVVDAIAGVIGNEFW